jgi:hypothetical protein
LSSLSPFSPPSGPLPLPQRYIALSLSLSLSGTVSLSLQPSLSSFYFVKLLLPGPCSCERSPADCGWNPATSSCCCTSHGPHLEKICEQSGGSRSLTHADGPLWAALLKTYRSDALAAPFSSSSSCDRSRSPQICPSTKPTSNDRTGTRDRDVCDKLEVTRSKCL